MHLVVGLGNPGARYQDSRHNVGFRCADEVARRHQAVFSRQLFDARIAWVDIAGKRVLLAKPQTYMNLSGRSVAPLLRYFGLAPAGLLVVYDDMDLPLGRIRVREQGSAGGHNGMKSIIAALGTQDFARVRIGIGPSGAQDAADYVLGRFTPDEAPLVVGALERAADAVEVVVAEGVATAMNRFNA